jgi:poly(hydroxyalkanoate) depolymerase family esterase
VTGWRELRDRLGGVLRDLARRSAAPRPSRVGEPGRWLEGAYRSTWAESRLVATERDYRLYLPPGDREDGRTPLVVMLHGCKQDATAFESGARMARLAQREGFALLYPEQRRRANPERCWNWFAGSSLEGLGEAALLAGMTGAIAERHALDRARVYVAGLSAGGAMTSILACTHTETFAAAAVHSGLMYRAAGSLSAAIAAMRGGSREDPAATVDGLRRGEAVAPPVMPMMVVHGDRDTVVHPRNAEQIVAQFGRLNGVPLDDPAPRGTSLDDREGRVPGGYAWRRTDWRRGEAIVLRRLIVVGLGHAWSGGDPSLPFNDPAGPDAGAEIWAFFSGHARTLPASHPAA